MAKLALSIAVGPYDRVRPLVDGDVGIDGVDPVFMSLSPEEIFFRAIRHEAFDVCELSLSSHFLRVSKGTAAYVGVPVFPSRAFRHSAIVVREDSGIRKPEDLNGKRIGIPEWQLTANVWARGLLADQYGVKASGIKWVRGGIEEPGRIEKAQVSLPPGVEIEDISPTQTLSEMLLNGEIDGFMGPRAPTAFLRGGSGLRWLFDSPSEEAKLYYEQTRVFPIMHLIGVRRSLAEQHPWLPIALFKAFQQSKHVALAQLADTSASKVSLPFVEEQLELARRLMGDDFWSYGVEPNHHVLELFARHHHEQGISSRTVEIEEIFHPTTFEMHKI